MWITAAIRYYVKESIGLPGALFLWLSIWFLYDCGVFTKAFWRQVGEQYWTLWDSFSFLFRFFCGCVRSDEWHLRKTVLENAPPNEGKLPREVKYPPDKVFHKAEFISPHCGSCDLCYSRRNCPMKTWRVLLQVYRPRVVLANVACVIGIACAAFKLSIRLLPVNSPPNTDANDKILRILRSFEPEYDIMYNLLLQGGIASLAALLVSRRMIRVTTTLTAAAGYSFLQKMAFFAFLHLFSMIPSILVIVLEWYDMSKLHSMSHVPLSASWTVFYALVFAFTLRVCVISVLVVLKERQRIVTMYDPLSFPDDVRVVLLATNEDESAQTISGVAPLSTASLLRRRFSEDPAEQQLSHAVPRTNQLTTAHNNEINWCLPTAESARGCGCKCCSGTGMFQMDKSNKEYSASLFSSLSFGWVTPLISLGYSRSLESNDLSDLPSWMGSGRSEKKFDGIWQREYRSKGEKASFSKVFLLFCCSTLIRTGCLELIYDCLHFVGPITLNILTKFLVKCQWAIYASDKTEERTPVGSLYLEGLGTALALLCARVTMSALVHQQCQMETNLTISLGSGLMGAVYSKALRILSRAEDTSKKGEDHSSEAEHSPSKIQDKEVSKMSWFWKTVNYCTCRGYTKQKNPKTTAITTGEIVNLMQVDVSRLTGVLECIHMLWSTPFQIIISLVLLWGQLGPSTVAGVAIMCFSVPVGALVCARLERIQEELMEIRDERIKLTNEALAAMKIIKMYAWEDSIKQRVEDIRQKEMKKLWSSRLLNIFQRVFWFIVPVLVSVASFLAYVASGHTLDAATAFTSISLFNTLRFPLAVLPWMFTVFTEAAVAARRLTQFLVRPEIKALHPPPRMSMIDPAKPTIVAEHLTLRWPNNSPLLDDVSFSCFPGTITAVIGRTGVGKSGLLACLIGDVEPQPLTTDGTKRSNLETHGRIAYVAQTPWIINATLRANIVFGMPFNANWYSKVVHACALLPDLEILPAGDLTEIGEKGVNLSGGQKQRVSLARAIYRSGKFPARHNVELPCDIYIFDDCLSAVDSHVGQHIFEHAIKGILRSDSRTVLFVTHKVDILPMVDNIVFLGRRSSAIASDNLTNLVMDRNDSVYGVDAARDDYAPTKSPIISVGVLLAVGPHSKLQSRKDYTLFTERALSEGTEAVAHADTGPCIEFDSVQSESPGRPVLRTPSPPPLDLLTDATLPLVTASKPPTPVKKCGPSIHEVFGSVQNPCNETAVSLAGKIPVIMQHVLDQGLRSARQRSSSIQTSMSALDFAEKLRIERPKEQGVDASKEAKLTDAEHAATGSVSGSVYFAYFRGFGSASMAVALLSSLITVQSAEVAANFWISYWSDHANVVDGLSVGISIYAALALTQTIVLILNSYLFAISSQRAALFFHTSLVGRMVRAPMSFFDATPLGRIINRFSKDINTIDEALPEVISEYFDHLFGVIATFLVIIMSTRWFAIICVPLVLIYASAQRFYIPTGRQLQRIESVLRSPVFAHLSETLDGVPTIRAYRAQERFKQGNLALIDEMQRASYAVNSCHRWIAIRLEIIGTMVIFSTAVLAVIGGLNGSISAGVGGLIITYALSTTGALNWMVRMAGDVQTNLVSVERVQEYVEGCPQEAAAIIAAKRPPVDWPQKGALELIDYQLRYRDGLPLVLKGISAKIEPSDKVGVVGRTGAGKSSLLIALLRIVEKAGGFVFVDDIDVSEIGLFDLRSRFSIIPQDPILFTGTLRFNLDPFDKCTDGEIWRALERSHLETFVSNQFEGGLEGNIEEGGRNLSMGQRQLICLARALLRNSKILLLDEATSAVDPITDKLIQETIRTYFADCTVITIAHRIATIIDYDKILVLENGTIKEFGPPMELIAREGGLFRQLCLNSRLDVDIRSSPAQHEE